MDGRQKDNHDLVDGCRQKEKPNSNERGDVPALVTCSAVNTHCKVDGDSFLPVEMQRFSRFS